MLNGGTAAAAATTSTVKYHPMTISKFYKSSAAGSAFPTPSECLKAYGLACYTPALMRKAYNIPASWTGKGQKIVIVDAYGSPTARADLQTFSDTFGLPAAKFDTYCASKCPRTVDPGWAGETSLDVQWAHAIAPAAKINLVVATDNSNVAIDKAVKYAITHNLGDVLSMSYGSDESDYKTHADIKELLASHDLFADATAKNISLFASSGDNGASDSKPKVTASYPASDPLVTAVGGTNLYMSDNGTYQAETVWGDQEDCPLGCRYGPIGATGGAPSVFFSAPRYEKNVTGYKMRTTSDVSYDASVYTSVLVYNGFNANPDDNGFYFVGGTSAGSPQWAGIGALANEQAGHRLGQLNPQLFGLFGSSDYNRAFHDVKSGNNAWHGPGFSAGKNYDLPTGLGSPNVKNLVNALKGRAPGNA